MNLPRLLIKMEMKKNKIGTLNLPVMILSVFSILVLLFGAKVAVGLGKTSGETVKEIKKIKRTFTEAIDDDANEPHKN